MKNSVEVGDAFRGVEGSGYKDVIMLIIISEDTYAYYHKGYGWRTANKLLNQYVKATLLNKGYYEKLT